MSTDRTAGRLMLRCHRVMADGSVSEAPSQVEVARISIPVRLYPNQTKARTCIMLRTGGHMEACESLEELLASITREE